MKTQKEIFDYILDQLDIDRDQWLYLIDKIEEYLAEQIKPEISLIESTQTTNDKTFLRLLVDTKFLSDEYAASLGQAIITKHKDYIKEL